MDHLVSEKEAGYFAFFDLWRVYCLLCCFFFFFFFVFIIVCFALPLGVIDKLYSVIVVLHGHLLF